MLTEYKRLLCPVQFDQNSLVALGVAKQIGKQNNGKLFVMHVVYPARMRIGGSGLAAHDKKIAEQELARLEPDQLKDIEHEVILRLGNPAEEVLKAEHEFAIDLVVMATHGRTGVSHLVLGSVAERVVRESVCPVLTLRPQ